MLIDDRIGFACTFLSDTDLIDYIKNLTETVYQNGDLTGMLLTGNCIVLSGLFRVLRALIISRVIDRYN